MCYQLTAESFNCNELYNIGITVLSIISDMWPQNKALCIKIKNIIAGKHSKIVNFIEHPVIATEKLFVLLHPVHVFKNIPAAITNRHKFVFSNYIVTKYQLPSDIVNIESFIQLYELGKIMF